MHAYIHSFIHTYLHTYIPTYILCIPKHLHYIHSCTHIIRTHVPTYTRTDDRPTNLHAFVRTCIFASRMAGLGWSASCFAADYFRALLRAPRTNSSGRANFSKSMLASTTFGAPALRKEAPAGTQTHATISGVLPSQESWWRVTLMLECPRLFRRPAPIQAHTSSTCPPLLSFGAPGSKHDCSTDKRLLAARPSQLGPL